MGRSVARRKKKEEEPEWKPPEFDEVEFMRKEISGARAAAAVVGWAILGALVSFVLFPVNWILAFFVGLLAVIGLFYVFPFVGIRTKTFQRRDWIGHGAIYFFSWLAFWIVLLNPPFSDHADPAVFGFQVGSYNPAVNPGPARWSVSCIVPTSSSVSVPLGTNTTIFVVFRATDNAGVPSVQVTVNGVPADATEVSGDSGCKPTGATYAAGSRTLSVPVSGSSPIVLDIVATDAGGRRAAASLTISPA